MPMQRAVTSATKVAAHTSRQINAVVIRSGFMQKTVTVRIGTQIWNKHLQKKFNGTSHVLVHDPNSSLTTGDVISISPGWKTSRTVHHVVNSIIAPFGTPIADRPPIPTAEERIAERERRLMTKDVRKGRWSRWGFERDPRGIEGGEWYSEEWVRDNMVKVEESVNGEEVKLV